MGRALLPGLRAADGVRVVGEVEKGDDLLAIARGAGADVVVDFTEPAAAVANSRAVIAAGAQGVIGTTGFSPEDVDALDAEAREAGVGLLVAPNFAIGMILLQRFAEEAARHLPAAEIVEAHHEGKVDAPSGTALDTARRIAAAGARSPGDATARSRGLDVEGVLVHSLRVPGVVARQEVWFGSAGERLRLEHDVVGRECFLPGVLVGIRRIGGRRGVVRGLAELLFEDA
jgi:4-hydroxy-tetrahydrodipicolinate reductase